MLCIIRMLALISINETHIYIHSCVFLLFFDARLQFMGEVEYSLSQRSFHITLLKGVSRAELEEACVKLHRTLARAEALEAEKVDGT